MIVFRNPGIIEPTSFTTFGLTSKEGSGKIGRFGTGLKYALATIIRGGGDVSIYSGDARYTFSKSAIDFRGSEHNQILVNGDPLPFTESLGRDWKPWMAFRELYSNAIDENGALERHEGTPELSGDETLICVEYNAFEAIYFSIEEHFIVDEEPIWSSDDIEVYEGQSKFIFNRGIAVMEMDKPAAFRYNIKGYVALTEDRTAAHPWWVNETVAAALVQTTNERVAEAITLVTNDYEGKLKFTEAETEPTATFLGAAAKHGLNCNPTAATLVEAYAPRPDQDSVSIISPERPGGRCLLNTISALRALGENVSDVHWVLDPNTNLPNGFLIRGSAIMISADVFDDQQSMDAAVFTAWDKFIGRGWWVRKLKSLAADKMAETTQ